MGKRSAIFEFTPHDFKDCGRSARSNQKLRNKFKTFENTLLERLPSQFESFKSKGSHYVSRIKSRDGKLREVIWFGMANGDLYPNPRHGIQYQFGIDSEGLHFNGIWIEGTYDARKARLQARSILIEKRRQFIKLLKKLGPFFFTNCLCK